MLSELSRPHFKNKVAFSYYDFSQCANLFPSHPLPSENLLFLVNDKSFNELGVGQ